MKNIVFAAVALFAVSANAADLVELDLDQDGAISMEEAASVEGMNSDVWAQLDANADGKLDEAEFAMFEELNVAPIEEAADAAVEAVEEAAKSE
mgnify:FL=1